MINGMIRDGRIVMPAIWNVPLVIVIATSLAQIMYVVVAIVPQVERKSGVRIIFLIPLNCDLLGIKHLPR